MTWITQQQKKSGLTRVEFAEKIGITQPTLDKREKMPSEFTLSNIEAISILVNIKPHKVMSNLFNGIKW
tara:strand:+ start:556 stop:762 length:207 start_codon:yes stop_codon:yes gene_type:complete